MNSSGGMRNGVEVSGFLLCVEGTENKDKEDLQMEQLLPLA